MLKRHFLTLGLAVLGAIGTAAQAQTPAAQTPRELIKQISDEVLDSIRADKAIQSGDGERIKALVDSKILPHVDFEAITRFATGGDAWDKASADQRRRLQDEFKADLLRQYAFAFSKVRDETIEIVRVTKSPDSPDEVIVRTNIVGKQKTPLNYYLHRVADRWKIIDLDVESVRLGLQYRSQWQPVVKAKGIDGLITELAQRAKSPPASKS